MRTLLYLVRHGAGYSVFEHHSQGLKQTTQLFIEPDAPVKVIKLRLENTWQRPRRVTVTYYAEWVLGVYREQTQLHVQTSVDPQSGAIFAQNHFQAEFSQQVENIL